MENRSAAWSRKSEVGERNVHGADDAARALVDRRREPEADRGHAVAPELVDDLVEQFEELLAGLGRGRAFDPIEDLTVAVDHPGCDLRPADVDTDGPFGHAATIRRRMAQGEKPYRVYRGGRVKGRVPTLGQPERAPARTDGRRAGSRARAEAARTEARAELGSLDRDRRGRVLRPRARLGRRQLPLHSERRKGREQAASRIGEGGARSAERADALEPERDSAARHGPLVEDPGPRTASSARTR